MPAPERFEAFFFQCDRHDQLGPLVEALRPLRLQGILRSTVHIANDYKVLAGIQQYPWQETNGATPLRPDLMRQLRSRLKFGAWSGSGGLYGTRGQVAEAKRAIRRALKGKVDRLQFLDDRRLAFASRFAKLYQFLTGWDLSRTLDLARPVYGLMKGVPTEKPLKAHIGVRKPLLLQIWTRIVTAAACCGMRRSLRWRVATLRWSSRSRTASCLSMVSNPASR